MGIKRVIVGGDHSTVVLKDDAISHLQRAGFSIMDVGTNDSYSIDYPIISSRVSQKLSKHKGTYAVVFCGTGIGIANGIGRQGDKHKVINSMHPQYIRDMIKKYPDIRVLSIGARYVTENLMIECIDAFFQTHYDKFKRDERLEAAREAVEGTTDPY